MPSAVDIGVVKTSTNTLVSYEGPMDYYIDVTNYGTITATNVIIQDILASDPLYQFDTTQPGHQDGTP